MENGSNVACEIGSESQASAPQNHHASLPKKRVTREMDDAIQRLIGKQPSRGALLDLFDNRATAAAIKAWRYGWRGSPQWAVELIRSKLAAQARADLAAGAKLRPGAGMGWNKGAKTLAVWRERKARERDAKEKAANEAAPRQNESGGG